MDLSSFSELSRRLDDPAVWVEPPSDLQERIVGSIAGGPGALPSRHRRPAWFRVVSLGVAAAVLISIGIAFASLREGTSSPRYTGALAGTSLAEGASGNVVLTRTQSGWRIRLHARGLPRLDNGSYYEAWLKSEAGVLVAIGTFNEATDVTLWSGVSPKDFPKLTVTRQSVADGAASSGRVVLAGVASLAR